MDIMILGDSIARGVLYDEEKQRYGICRDTFMTVLKEKYETVKNLARVGGTVADAQRIFEANTPPAGARVVIEVGGNDSDLNWDEVASAPDVFHEAKVPLAEFTDRLTALVRRVRQANLSPVLVTPLPVAAEKYLRWISRGRDGEAIVRYLGSPRFIYRWQERYSLAVAKVAAGENVRLFDLRSCFLEERNFESLMCADGIHPTAEGQRHITEAVKLFFSPQSVLL